MWSDCSVTKCCNHKIKPLSSRRNTYPPTHKIRSELNVSGEWVTTLNGVKILISGAEDDKPVISGT